VRASLGRMLGRRSPDVGSDLHWERLDEQEEHRYLCRNRLEHLVEVREPLVLVSQIPRSGGTLLSQLFDGHPECHAHPGELEIGYPTRFDWPELDIDAGPDRWFEILYEKKAQAHLRRGYAKTGLGSEAERFPFLFSPRLQKAIFDRCTDSRLINCERDILDCYFTSYFNAWLDNHNLYTAPKKLVAGFLPRPSGDVQVLERFFAVYPDGFLISAIRDPRAWYTSARELERDEYRTVESGIELWRQSAEAALAAASDHGDHVVLVTYDQLVLETEPTMHRIAERLGVSMSPVLLEPTFNGRPIRANSNFAVDAPGILRERTTAYRHMLDADAVAQIEEAAGDLYERVSAVSRAG
jgi:Sulfotransferase family